MLRGGTTIRPEFIEPRGTNDELSLPSRTTRASRAAFTARMVLMALALLVAPATSATRPALAAASPWTLSGSPDGTGHFYVDDNIDVFLNGDTIFTQNVPPGTPGDRLPIPFLADVGDVLQIRVRDSYGVCAALSRLYLTDSSGRSTIATPGFDDGCVQPPGDRGVVFDTTLVIPDLAPPAPGYQEVLLPGATLAGVVRGPGGMLYGVTYDGGVNDLGTIFRASPDLSTVTVLHSFDGTDGQVPYGELTLHGTMFYGTTHSGGAGGSGTVFSFDPATGALVTLASFSYPYSHPIAPLLARGDYLYGSTGSYPTGSTVFRLRTDGSGGPVILHEFSDPDGLSPGGVIYGPGGFLYGTAQYGGLAGCYPFPYNGCGTVFRLRPDGTGQGQSGFEVIHRFTSATLRGYSFPQRRLVNPNDGHLYGTTLKGVFRVEPDPAAPAFQVLYAVPSGQGSQIFAPPIEGVGGRLFVDQYDGGSGAGTVYSMTRAGLDVTLHHQFDFDAGGFGPYGIMHADPPGTIYGTTEYNSCCLNPPYRGTLFAIRGLTAAPTTPTTLITSLNPATAGQAVTFTATVNGVSPTGTVTFYDGAASLGTVALVGGSASLITSSLTVGTHFINATYDGDVDDPAGASNVVVENVNAPGAGDIADTLTIAPAAGGDITLSWGASCSATDTDYSVYEGGLGSYYTHVARLCSTGGATSVTLTPPSGASVYYLVVPRNAAFEGVYGKASSGAPIPPGGTTCTAQLVTTDCP